MAIAGDVRSLIPNFNKAIQAAHQLSRKNCARKTGSDDYKLHEREWRSSPHANNAQKILSDKNGKERPRGSAKNSDLVNGRTNAP
jgi:hypothetical protein